MTVETDAEIIERLRERFEVLEDMTRAVKRGKVRALIVSGAPGVGKSHFVADLCKELEARDRIVTILSKTHASCAELNCKLVAAGSTFRAQTADHWVNATVRRGVCQSDCIILEEITMLNSHSGI